MIKDLIESDEPIEESTQSARSSEPVVLSLFSEAPDKPDEPYILSNAEPETMAETVRKSGLAYSAGIALFASVAFMLIIGWGADLLFGSSPWGIVVGIVIGALVGFIQFFRITSQIFKK